MWFLGLLAVLLVGTSGCARPDESPAPVAGSTYRIGTAISGEKTDLTLKVFREASDCQARFGPEGVEACLPRVNRATGQVRLGFELLDKTTRQPYYLPLQMDHVEVSHDRSPVREGSKSAVRLVPHGERRAGQLFVLLIDGSGSMFDNDNEQIDKVYKALLNPRVKRAFFPDDVQTGVVLLRFTHRVTGIDGRPPVVLERVQDYEEMVRTWLYRSPRGYTHLYDAVAYAIRPLMDEPSVREWLGLHKAEPTVIALTDGFNNEAASDRCRTNTPRLQELLEELEIARNQPLGLRPTVYTVGLGVPIRPGFDEVPKGRVTERALCGRYLNEGIDGGLERRGIDNVSLRWIAERGGGTSFVKNSPGGLSDVFRAAAAVRYAWYQVQYKVDRFHHRQPFETRIRLTSFADADATVPFYPSGWLDGPTGQQDEGWSVPGPWWRTFALAVPLGGLLGFLSFVGPASFSVRRSVTRRARGRDG